MKYGFENYVSKKEQNIMYLKNSDKLLEQYCIRLFFVTLWCNFRLNLGFSKLLLLWLKRMLQPYLPDSIILYYYINIYVVNSKFILKECNNISVCISEIKIIH